MTEFVGDRVNACSKLAFGFSKMELPDGTRVSDLRTRRIEINSARLEKMNRGLARKRTQLAELGAELNRLSDDLARDTAAEPDPRQERQRQSLEQLKVVEKETRAYLDRWEHLLESGEILQLNQANRKKRFLRKVGDLVHAFQDSL